MSFPAAVPGRKYLGKRDLRVRYGNVSGKTIDRWKVSGALPPPDFTINQREFWGEDRLDEHDRARTVAAGAKGKPAKPAATTNHKEPTNSAA